MGKPGVLVGVPTSMVYSRYLLTYGVGRYLADDKSMDAGIRLFELGRTDYKLLKIRIIAEIYGFQLRLTR